MDNYQQGVDQQATGDDGNVQNQNGNTGANNGSGDSNRARNGLWINQLPKALRSSFDGEEMPTIGDLAREYIRLKELKEGTEGNQDNAKPARKHPEESYAEVKKYFAEGDGFDARRDQKLFALGGILDVLFLYLLLQILQNGVGGVDSDITHNQDLFDFLIKILVNRGISAENTVDTGRDIRPGLGKTGHQPAEKAFFLLRHILSP